MGNVALAVYLCHRKTPRARLPAKVMRSGLAGLVMTLALLALPLAGWAGQTGGPPQRVVSFNLCTDQLAMMLAAPGQLVSVSSLAADPDVSLMAAEARAYPGNGGQAETIYLLNPDLVLAGSYSARATVDILRRLGLRVETIPPASSIEGVRENITRIGALLGADARAAALLAQFDADLAALPDPNPANAALAANYEANGYTTGRATLAGDIMRAAGYALLTDRLGMDYGGTLPLEQLVMGDPALIVSGSRYDRTTRSEEILTHPALAALEAQRSYVADRDWICGLPHVAHVAARLAATR